MYSEISANKLLQCRDKGEKLNLPDLRKEMEFHTFNIGGKNLPLQSIGVEHTGIIVNKSEDIIVICSAGLPGAAAAAVLAGYSNVRNLTGGLIGLRKVKH